MVNKVILVGNLCADPERKTMQGGDVLVKLRLATNEKFKDREGNLQEKTEFHTVIFWGRQAETLDRHARKGQALYVEGKLQTRSWETDAGEKRYATEINGRDFRFLGGRKDREDERKPREERRDSEPKGGGGGEWGEEALPF